MADNDNTNRCQHKVWRERGARCKNKTQKYTRQRKGEVGGHEEFCTQHANGFGSLHNNPEYFDHPWSNKWH